MHPARKTNLVVAAIAVTALAGCTGSHGTAAPVAAVSDSPPATAPAATAAPTCTPTFDASSFVKAINNPYYPLPVGRKMVYRGVRDGQKQTDTVTVTSRTKVIDGVSAMVVTDRADHNGTILEDTVDYFAQDRTGNVWYLGEDTKSISADGTVDTSGSWTAGVNGAVPGIIMLANPQIPCGYRQEFLKGEAEDTAWITGRDGTVKVPYGTIQHAIRSLEVTVLEPDVIDEKIYGPGLGIVRERSVSGPNETSDLVSVTG
jgi:hypothetical protein